MKGMSEIVQTVSKIIVGIIFIYGMYIMLHDHMTPGGGFAGGAVIAGALILLVLAFGSPRERLKTQSGLRKLFISLSSFAFLFIAFIGILLGSRIFFNNYLLNIFGGELLGAGTILYYNIAVGIAVSAAMFSIFLALNIYKEESEK